MSDKQDLTLTLPLAVGRRFVSLALPEPPFLCVGSHHHILCPCPKENCTGMGIPDPMFSLPVELQVVMHGDPHHVPQDSSHGPQQRLPKGLKLWGRARICPDPLMFR